MKTHITHIRLSKEFVIKQFGGVEAAAQACGLSSVQAVYAWPELLSIRQSLMCHGALCLLAAPTRQPTPSPAKKRRSWLTRRAA